MKSTLGKTLRKIRVGKQVSICSLADETLSKSQISRFERGESEISCARLINILDKLHTSLEEFMIIHNDESASNTDTFFNLMKYIRKAYFAQNTAALMNLLSTNSDFKLNSFEKTMVKSIVHTLNNNVRPTKEEMQLLIDYLFKVEKWGYYEITLLGNCVETIQYSSFFLLTKEILKNSTYSSLNKNNKRLVTQLAINCLTMSIDLKEFANCEYLIQEIEQLLNNELNYYEQTIFLYTTGYFEFTKGDQEGLVKMKKAVQVFSILGETALKDTYTKHFVKHVGKNLII